MRTNRKRRQKIWSGSPLIHRLPREFKEDLGKYLVIFFLMVGCIGLVSGFMVADGSMLQAYNESFEKYNIEDGHFYTERKLNDALHRDVESLGIELYDMFFVEKRMENGSKLRLFQNRQEVNKVCVMSGRLPEQADEIAVDRMYADNNNLKIGDSIAVASSSKTDGVTSSASSTEDDSQNSTVRTSSDTKESDSSRYAGSGKQYKIVGLVACSDYSALFENNSDAMFDAANFGVAIVSDEAFETFARSQITWNYSWKYVNPPKDTVEAADRSEDLLSDLNKTIDLTEYVPQYENQAITFTGDDMGGDGMMIAVLFYIIIGIIALVFAVTISSILTREASVIGTLLASGYTKGELIRHYMTLPLIITLISAILGNILGYTYFKGVMADLYYGSYSLPTYETIWNGNAFFMTTVIPFLMMLVINYGTLRYTMTLPPLNFLRGDLSHRKHRFALPLPKRLPFFMRFHIRVILQNLGNYIILFVGICFANLLLLFGMGLPEILSNYTETVQNSMICDYQYILEVPANTMREDRKLESFFNLMWYQFQVDTDVDGAEKFSAYVLRSQEENIKEEDVMLYGVKKDSDYIQADLTEDAVYISQQMAEKYELTAGDSITLRESYGTETYTFDITGVYPYDGGICLFLNQDTLNKRFDLGSDYFSGYFSNSELNDINKEYIGSIIDLNAITRISRQLTISMGEMAGMVQVFAIMIFMLLIYLLSRVILEKNASSISMVKILGYRDTEIGMLYIMATTMIVLLCLLLTIPLMAWVLKEVFFIVMRQKMVGWLSFYVAPSIYPKMFGLGVATYLIVALLELRKIRKIPMDEALKQVL